MADLSNVPPEVMQILTHDPPYSRGELAILQAYAIRPDANPVMVRAFEHLGVTAPHAPGPPPPSSDFGIPGLDIPDSIGGIGLPTLDFMQPEYPNGGGSTAYAPSEPSSFHQDLPHQGAADINFEKMRTGRESNSHRPTLDWAAPIGEALDSGGGGLFTPGGVSSSGGTVYIPALDGPGGGGSSSSSGVDPYVNAAQPTSSMTALFGESPATSRAPDGTPAGSNTVTQGLGTPGSTTDWKAEALRTAIPESRLFSDPNSAFASLANSQIDRVAANPELIAQQLYADAPLAAANQTEWLQNIKMLSDLGLLSDVPNADIFSGKPESGVTTLEQIEAVNNAFRGGHGSQVDPRALYHQAFSRILNSDAQTFVDPNQGGGVAGDAENQVAVTNGMLGAVTPFVYSGSQEGYIQRLNQAGLQYIGEVATSRTSLSYPEWLKSQGAMDWL
jgi:hypothetical protein